MSNKQMLRVIKFWGNYNDTVQFSNCSTYYEVLPIVLDDTATERELLEICLSNGIANDGVAKIERTNSGYRYIKLKAAIKLKDKVMQDSGVYLRGNIEPRVAYLGLVTIPQSTALPIYDGVDKAVTKEQASNLINNQECSIAYTCELDGEQYLVKQDWDYLHSIKFLGYSLDSFREHAGIQNETFEDEVTSCGECGEYMWNDNGYTYNYRVVNECELLGIACGCYEAHVLNSYEEFIDNGSKAIELDVAETLSKQGKLTFVERFIGGMTDGRGGSYAGVATREGTPETILKDLKSKHPKREYVFSRDESGQFQTYFSVWQVTKPKKGQK